MAPHVCGAKMLQWPCTIHKQYTNLYRIPRNTEPVEPCPHTTDGQCSTHKMSEAIISDTFFLAVHDGYHHGAIHTIAMRLHKQELPSC